MPRLLHQNSELIVREVEAELFLIDEEGGTIHHLNGTASALWRMLERPATSNAIIGQFRFLFPDEDARHLKAALRTVIQDLVDLDILLRTKKLRAG